MPRLLVCLIGTFLFTSHLPAQSLEIIHLPQFVQGINGTNNQRLPFVYRARLSGLVPRGTYRYYNQFVSSGDGANTAGAGNCIFAVEGGFLRTTGPSLSIAGGYGSFSADSTGTYAGWFVNETTGNTRFTPGRYVFVRIAINDGAVGTAVATRLTSTDSIRVLALDTTRNENSGTGVRGSSDAPPRQIVLLYGNIEGVGRPVAGTFVESDGTDNSTANSYVSFYAKSVNGNNGAFGALIPNNLTQGIRRVELHTLEAGSLVGLAIDDDGDWPGGAHTVSPAQGQTELVLTELDAPAAVRYAVFSASVVRPGVVRLEWRTLSEVNNLGFVVQRKLPSSSIWEEVSQDTIRGYGTGFIPMDYSTWDSSAPPGNCQYRLKQMDFGGTARYADPVEVLVTMVSGGTAAKTLTFENVFPNPCNPSATLRFHLSDNGHVMIQVVDILGNEVARPIDEWETAGEKTVKFEAAGLASGVYFCRVHAGALVKTIKICVVR